MRVGLINEQVNGVNSGDICESCDKKEKTMYHLEDEKYGIDIILCPSCVEKFKTAVSSIPV